LGLVGVNKTRNNNQTKRRWEKRKENKPHKDTKAWARKTRGRGTTPRLGYNREEKGGGGNSRIHVRRKQKRKKSRKGDQP